MAKKPEAPKPIIWNVYKIAKEAVWLGTVEASDKQAAVEKAAQEFKTEVWRLYAVLQADRSCSAQKQVGRPEGRPLIAAEWIELLARRRPLPLRRDTPAPHSLPFP
jgi:hypothetical protein